MHLLQVEGHLHSLVQGFTKTDDAAGAHADACLLGGTDDVFLVFHGVGGADFREIGRRGFDVAVNPGDAGLLQALRLLFGNKTQGAAHFDAHFFANSFHDVDDFFKLVRIVLVASAGDEGETDRAGFLSFLGSGKDFFLRQEPIDGGSCVVPTGLGTELAILLAVAASCVDDGAEVYSVSGELLADLIGHGQEEHGVLIFRLDQCLCFFFGNFTTIHDFLSQSDNFCASAFHDRSPFLWSRSTAHLYCYLG